MELILTNIKYCEKNQTVLSDITATIQSEKITGVTGEHKTIFLEILDAIRLIKEGELKVGSLILSKETLLDYRRTVALIMQNPLDQFFTSTVKEEMNFLVSSLQYNHKDLNKKMLDSLKLVGLTETYYEKELQTLSSGEQKLIQIAMSLLCNPKVILLDEPFVELDYQNKRKVLQLIKQLKYKHHKAVVIASNDSNLLYSLADDIMVLKEGKLIAMDSATKIYKDIDFLKKQEIEIPKSAEFTYKAKQKKIRLMYHKDIRDLIKDIYKHV